jgi:hypothetical protein
MLEGFSGSRYTSSDVVVPKYQNVNDPNFRCVLSLPSHSWRRMHFVNDLHA